MAKKECCENCCYHTYERDCDYEYDIYCKLNDEWTTPNNICLSWTEAERKG